MILNNEMYRQSLHSKIFFATVADIILNGKPGIKLEGTTDELALVEQAVKSVREILRLSLTKDTELSVIGEAITKKNTVVKLFEEKFNVKFPG